MVTKQQKPWWCSGEGHERFMANLERLEMLGCTKAAEARRQIMAAELEHDGDADTEKH
jgi:hypothetical protein